MLYIRIGTLHRSACVALTLLAALTLALPARAQAPVDGTYKSTDLGGQMQTGRVSESWTIPTGYNTAGNVINVRSWDGSVMGGQWWVACATLNLAPSLIFDTVDENGNGFRSFVLSYSGGSAWLGNGPWNGGLSDYPALIEEYTEVVTLQYFGNSVVGANSNVSFEARFTGFPNSCVGFAIGNRVEVGNTDGSTLPADYPEFFDSSCSSTPTLGSWGYVSGLTITVANCTTVPVSEKSWGAVKAMYAN